MQQFWGQHLILDLDGCPKSLISNYDNIRNWNDDLIKTIDMKAFGEPFLEHFAEEKEETAGYTLLQPIETSNTAAHFAERLGQVYLDIFSCKAYDIEDAIGIAIKYFEPKTIVIRDLMRGDFNNEESIKVEIRHYA